MVFLNAKWLNKPVIQGKLIMRYVRALLAFCDKPAIKFCKNMICKCNLFCMKS